MAKPVPIQQNLDPMIQTEETDENDSPGTRPNVVVSISDLAWTDAISDAAGRSESIAKLAYVMGSRTLGAALPAPEISVLLTSDAEVAVLNAQHRNMPKPTNVLSFPGLTADQIEGRSSVIEEQPALLGDVVLAYETVASEAARANKPIADHLAHLLVHGVLHLLGFDHTTEETAHRMERLETEILEQFGVGDPYVVD